MIVKLTEREMELAAFVGMQRQFRAAANPTARTKNNQPVEEALQAHIIGAQGELAVARFTGCYWSGLTERGAPDVGGFLDVRTARDENHSLLLYKDEDPEKCTMMVVAKPPIFRMAGWAWAIDVKKPEFLRDPVGGREAYFVPQSALRPAKTILGLITRHFEERELKITGEPV